MDFTHEFVSYVYEVEVVSPKWVREEVASYARNLYKMYKEDINDLDKMDRLGNQ